MQPLQRDLCSSNKTPHSTPPSTTTESDRLSRCRAVLCAVERGVVSASDAARCIEEIASNVWMRIL